MGQDDHGISGVWTTTRYPITGGLVRRRGVSLKESWDKLVLEAWESNKAIVNGEKQQREVGMGRKERRAIETK